MTLEEFSDIFAMLAIQLHHTDADEVAIRAYYEAMKDCEVEFVMMAAQQLARDDRADAWFPKTPEWRRAVHAAERQRVDDVCARVRARLSAGLPPLCAECNDTGFQAVNDPLCRYNRVKPCDCRQLRRLEVLGRRRLPELPEATQDNNAPQTNVVEIARRIAAKKRMR